MQLGIWFGLGLAHKCVVYIVSPRYNLHIYVTSLQEYTADILARLVYE